MWAEKRGMCSGVKHRTSACCSSCSPSEAIWCGSSRTEEEERNFWARIDLTDYFERKDFQSVSFPNLKPSSRPISLRLPEPMILRLKERANERRVPYQSLIKQYIAEGLKT